MVLHVTADSARDMYQTGIGAHVSQSELIRVSSSTHGSHCAVARGLLPEPLLGYTDLDCSWKLLGMTPSTYSWGQYRT